MAAGRVLQEDLFPEEELLELAGRGCGDRRTGGVRELYADIPLPHFDAPRDDNQKLLNLQYEFLRTGSDGARREFFTMAYEVIHRIIWHYAGRECWDEERRLDAASAAFEYVFRRYTDGSGWHVGKNFISALKNGVRHALWYRTRKDREESLDEMMERGFDI